MQWGERGAAYRLIDNMYLRYVYVTVHYIYVKYMLYIYILGVVGKSWAGNSQKYISVPAISTQNLLFRVYFA